MTKNDRKRLFKLFRESGEPNFQKFLDDLGKDVVIEAAHVFEEKKRQDEFWRKAVKRHEKIGKPLEED